MASYHCHPVAWLRWRQGSKFITLTAPKSELVCSNLFQNEISSAPKIATNDPWYGRSIDSAYELQDADECFGLQMRKDLGAGCVMRRDTRYIDRSWWLKSKERANNVGLTDLTKHWGLSESQEAEDGMCKRIGQSRRDLSGNQPSMKIIGYGWCGWGYWWKHYAFVAVWVKEH